MKLLLPKQGDTVLSYLSLQRMAGELMARVPKKGKRQVARGIHCCPDFLLFLILLPDQRRYTVKNMSIYTHIWQRRDGVWITVATK